ncbi:uncharacterized protein LOC122577461 isoform X1 [Bombus pyrosoma]|uniref:uncharacterized protein LOC122577461 isoform X1 n=1 Tax=Bombus pyrosoma TaxID=396416 RepID=UPI001CB9758B|nr:uncharacterized protein LOC122577461 isoform X1 [Bombus pyrosoma]XP_043604723.1 uncharacterized protein LOC122577461 isoform X1 [Bombus pyrosoma]
MCVLYVVMRSFGGYVRYCKLNKLFLVLVFIIIIIIFFYLSFLNILVCWGLYFFFAGVGYVGYGHGSTCTCSTCTVRIILFILISSSFLWRSSVCLPGLVFIVLAQEEKGFPKMCGWLVKTIQMNVRRLTSLRRLLPESWIFSCVTVLVVVAIMILNGEYRGVLVKGSLCRLSHARGRRVPKYVSGPRRCRQEQNIV